MSRPPRRPDAGLCALAAVLALGCIAPALADGPKPRQSLEQVEESLKSARARESALDRKAGEAAAALRAVQNRAVRLAAKAQDHEETLVRLGEQLEELEGRRAEARAALDERRRQLGGVLAALQRMSMHPPIALIALPAEPADTVRSALLMRRVAPAIENRARALRDRLEMLSEFAAAVEAAQARIDKENAALAKERDKLAALTAERARLAAKARGQAASARQEAARLGRKAENLRDLVANLSRERKQWALSPLPRRRPAAPPRLAMVPPPRETAIPAHGLPVRGRIVRTFGAADSSGGDSEGITIRTLSGAQVVAPTSGVVVFAGPFRGLGRLLIIEYGDEYHLLLAGLSRIDTAVGDEVLAGEPVGVMSTAGDERPTLYMELRRKSRPINPLPWLAARQTKVNG